jgi:predicted RNase H-like nuclease (RuvC/YqgF family)
VVSGLDAAAGNKSRRFIFVYRYGNMGRAVSCAMGGTLREDRGVFEDTRRWSGHARERWGSKSRKPRRIRQRKAKEDGARVIKVRALLGALVVTVLVAFAAGCGSVSDQNQARQEAKEKVEAKGQQARQEAEKKVNEKKQELKKKVEAKKQEVKEKVEALQKQVDDLQKEVQDLQKKIDAYEQKEQQQQINQLKKALKELKKKVEAQERKGQKLEK